jgi:hypothetical protein
MKTESGPTKYRLARLTSKSYGSVEHKYILQGWFEWGDADLITTTENGDVESSPVKLCGEWRDLPTVDGEE